MTLVISLSAANTELRSPVGVHSSHLDWTRHCETKWTSRPIKTPRSLHKM